MSEKMLSVLTNFGCDWSCPYCIYKNSDVHIKKTAENSFNWSKLEEEFKTNPCKEVSISGGGDPLYNWNKTQWFYDKLIYLTNKYHKKLELHTSYIDYDFPYYMFNRVVFHMMSIKYLRLIDKQHIHLPNNVRVVFVVEDYFTSDLLNRIATEVEHNTSITELPSFRQRVDNCGNTTYTLHEELKKYHLNKWYYITQCDYNDYFVDDKVEKEYLSIR